MYRDLKNCMNKAKKLEGKLLSFFNSKPSQQVKAIMTMRLSENFKKDWRKKKREKRLSFKNLKFSNKDISIWKRKIGL